MALLVEPASNNARKLFAGVDIAAPVSVVWDSLTDYDGLGTFLPGMAMMRNSARQTACALHAQDLLIELPITPRCFCRAGREQMPAKETAGRKAAADR